jgi:hypothetical protein
MLEETRDTITVPASLMIRMLASLNQIRRGQNKAFISSNFNKLFLRWWLEVRIHVYKLREIIIIPHQKQVRTPNVFF